MYFPRSLPDNFDQTFVYAFRAAFTAKSTSSSLASATFAKTFSFAGLIVSKYFPDFGATNCPLMNKSYCSFNLKCDVLSGAGAKSQVELKSIVCFFFI